jgi:acyl-CoA dehydrogenase
MAVTDTGVSPYKGMSMFIVPSDLPGIEIVRNVGARQPLPRHRPATARGDS